MNLAQVLDVLKEANAIIASLKEMGLKVEGTINLATILALINPPRNQP